MFRLESGQFTKDNPCTFANQHRAEYVVGLLATSDNITDPTIHRLGNDFWQAVVHVRGRFFVDWRTNQRQP
jgi:hypothetical protein